MLASGSSICDYKEKSSLGISGGLVQGPEVDTKIHRCSDPIVSPPYPGIQQTMAGKRPTGYVLNKHPRISGHAQFNPYSTLLKLNPYSTWVRGHMSDAQGK